MERFNFHFEGQCLTAYIKNGFIDRVFLTGDDVELNLTDDIVDAFSKQYANKHKGE